MRPFHCTVVLHVTHQGGIRQDDQMHVPCLAIAVSELTRAHTQVLLPVPVEGLCPGPASLVALKDAMRFPVSPVGDQDFPWLRSIGRRPQDQDPHRVVDVW